ncbi:hypothetical protein [Ignicoccus hospitalis]|uniref:Uncharacterized protein n=1 Tax=Ignicoccus hospitalis (strain KIN4/I / DSM 18386 / JCM 14125) TaxID=453591 RepID=A8ABD3_IGNH4|nr:hypothetical protein [Ignicoccus hospitalis]ABU82235.1 hypothetical protein Igni_1057 [Ignicoccus hospitalis KIN4/I]HIH90173.1 hypothetical protein [Desulfurococcaceae archaeon]
MSFKRREITPFHFKYFAPLREISLRNLPLGDSYDPVMCPSFQSEDPEAHTLLDSIARMQKSYNVVVKNDKDAINLKSIYRNLKGKKNFVSKVNKVASVTFKHHKACWSGLEGIVEPPPEVPSDVLADLEVGELCHSTARMLGYLALKIAQSLSYNDLAQRPPIALISHPAVEKVRVTVIPYSIAENPPFAVFVNGGKGGPKLPRDKVVLNTTVFVPTRLDLKEFVATVGLSVLSSVVSKGKLWDVGALIAVLDKATVEVLECANRPARAIGQNTLSEMEKRGLVTSTFRKYLNELHKEFDVDKYELVGTVTCVVVRTFLNDLVTLASGDFTQEVFRTAGYVPPLVRL